MEKSGLISIIFIILIYSILMNFSFFFAHEPPKKNKKVTMHSYVCII